MEPNVCLAPPPGRRLPCICVWVAKPFKKVQKSIPRETVDVYYQCFFGDSRGTRVSKSTQFDESCRSRTLLSPGSKNLMTLRTLTYWHQICAWPFCWVGTCHVYMYIGGKPPKKVQKRHLRRNCLCALSVHFRRSQGQ